MNAVWLEVTTQGEGGMWPGLMRDLLLTRRTAADAPAEGQVDAPIVRVTADLPVDAEGKWTIHVRGSNGHIVEVPIVVYSMFLAGYALRPEDGGPRGTDHLRVMEMLEGRTPGAPPLPMSPKEALAAAERLAQWARENGA